MRNAFFREEGESRRRQVSEGGESVNITDLPECGKNALRIFLLNMVL